MIDMDIKRQIVQIDSREKNNVHITNCFDNKTTRYLVSKLPFGDYWNWCNPFVIIERKNSLLEVARTLGTSHNEFLAEIKTATKYGVHMILLIEESDGFFDLDDINLWRNPYTKKNPKAMQGSTICKILKKYCEYYNFEVLFTTKSECADKILELLKAV